MAAYNNKIYFILSADGTANPSKVYCYNPSDGLSNSTNHSIIAETTGRFVTIRQINDLLYFSDDLGNVYSYDGATLTEMYGTPFTVNNFVSSIIEFNGSIYLGTFISSIYRYNGLTYEQVYEVSNHQRIQDMATWQKDGYLYVSVGAENVCCPPTGYTIRSSTGNTGSWETVFQNVWSTPILLPTSDQLYTAVIDSAYGYGSSIRKSSNGTSYPVIDQSSGSYKIFWGSFYHDGIAYVFTNQWGGGFGYRIVDENGLESRILNQNWGLLQAVELNGAVYALASSIPHTNLGSLGPADVYLITTATEPAVTMEWVYINDPGVPGHEPFNGYMSKYETTNAQYSQFLNTALTSEDITVGVDNIVYGANGSNSGADFVGQVYYDLAGPGFTYNGATNGGASRINWTGSSFTVDSDFENHPVTWVSWYGSTAFASYYGWRLPTEWEWQAVADYNGSQMNSDNYSYL